MLGVLLLLVCVRGVWVRLRAGFTGVMPPPRVPAWGSLQHHADGPTRWVSHGPAAPTYGAKHSQHAHVRALVVGGLSHRMITASWTTG